MATIANHDGCYPNHEDDRGSETTPIVIQYRGDDYGPNTDPDSHRGEEIILEVTDHREADAADHDDDEQLPHAKLPRPIIREVRHHMYSLRPVSSRGGLSGNSLRVRASASCVRQSGLP
jgi:hypothetical protein